MKKVALLLTTVVLLAACKKAPLPVTTDATTPQTENQAAAEMNKIAAAMGSGKPVSCSISKKDGTSSMKYYMKGEKIKVTGIDALESATNGVVLSDGKFFYSWDATTKKGIKMQSPPKNASPLPGAAENKPFPTLQSEDDVKRYQDDGYKVDCEVATVTDSEFVPPTDVEFTDMSALIKKAPSAVSPQSQADMEKQAQEMMKQYQGQ